MNSKKTILRSAVFSLLIMLLTVAWPLLTLAQEPILVKDINPGTDPSNPGGFEAVNGALFFSADDGIHGGELWKTDGTTAGTVLVHDTNPGPSRGNNGRLTNVNGVLFFNADDGTHGYELWKSDGTTAGTVLVKDIVSGPSGSNLEWFTNVGGTLFFTAEIDGLGPESELWKSDGTETGTLSVHVFTTTQEDDPGEYEAAISSLTYFNGTIFFAADDPDTGSELWAYDYILQVKIDIKPGSDPNSINCRNEKGVIPVAILTTNDFDATTVDHSKVTFEGASETHVDKKTGEPRRHEEDVDADGDIDLVFHFRLGDTALTCESIAGTLIGETFDGQAIEGSDTVRMVEGGGG